jgi:hypothetical protein
LAVAQVEFGQNGDGVFGDLKKAQHFYMLRSDDLRKKTKAN